VTKPPGLWLAGANQQFQRTYWNVFKESGWNQYPLVPIAKRVDAIVKHTLVADPDFRDLDALTGQIERGTLRFIEDVEGFLLKHEE
jgi:hypothetical protein